MTDEELIEQVARAIAAADGLNYDEVCGVVADPDNGECDSGTCLAAWDEDHDFDLSRRHYQHRARAILPIIKAERAEVVAEIVAWMRDEANGWMCADTASSEIEAKFGGRDETL